MITKSEAIEQAKAHIKSLVTNNQHYKQICMIIFGEGRCNIGSQLSEIGNDQTKCDAFQAAINRALEDLSHAFHYTFISFEIQLTPKDQILPKI